MLECMEEIIAEIFEIAPDGKKFLTLEMVKNYLKKKNKYDK